MAQPAEHDLTYYQGDDEVYRFTLRRKDDGEPIPLIGATVHCQIRTKYADDPLSEVLSDITGVFDTDGSDGIFSITIPSADTEAMAGKTYKYDIQVVLNGQTKTYVRGSLSGAKEYTRP